MTKSEIEKLDMLSSIMDFGSLSSIEKNWCTKGTICRFLRARNWDIDRAHDQLTKTLKWRQEYKPSQIIAEDIKTELNNEGKMYRNGYDKQNHPILYMKPGKDNTSSDQKDIKVKYLVYIMEKCTKAANKNNKEKLLLIVDFKNHSSLSGLTNLDTSLEVLNVLQNYYPETLFKALIVNAPWSLSIFWSMISPFLQEVTRQKMIFINEISEFLEYVDPDELEVDYGGKQEFKYSFEEHWKREDIEFPPDITNPHHFDIHIDTITIILQNANIDILFI